MRIAVIGTGFAGLVAGVSFAELDHEVIYADTDLEKIKRLARGEIQIYEPGLRELILRNAEAGRLSFTSNITEATRLSEVVILAPDSSPLSKGEPNFAELAAAAREVAYSMNNRKTIITKCSVPPGTNERLKRLMAELTDQSFAIVSVPAFLREGTAIKDAFNPDRIVIGSDDSTAAQTAAELHRPLSDKMVITDLRTAEIMNYVANAFLATKKAFMQEMASLCAKVGADAEKVALGVGYDHRIGHSFLAEGIGDNGFGFLKDAETLIQLACSVEHEVKLLESVVAINRVQRFAIIHKLEELLGDLRGLNIAVWGAAIRPNTNEVRDSQAIPIIRELVKKGATVKISDPLALPNLRKLVDADSIIWCVDGLEAACDADAICLLTEWEEYGRYQMKHLRRVMKQPVLVDARSMFREEQLLDSGFIYSSIGSHSMNTSLSPVKRPIA
ncbi:UDP-glucose dehydrogenase family protein [Paenibacillus silvisoli]|uniref:UDP-glucose dehydrogenase family protein n=1 Tax=Paenibacillus silvisoli TaxID=3110539 RepID=UPI0028042733|nr:nucleotide sugar dehydrogenase [Paenibacillus silvisoli]